MAALRQIVKRLPGMTSAIYTFRKFRGQILPREFTFTRAFEQNEWHDRESASGTGSNLEATRLLRQALPKLWAQYEISSVVDAPCGDFHWMREIADALGGTYTGLDIVRPLIELNRVAYGTERIKFKYANLLRAMLPKADLLLCRDCLVHFSYRDIKRALKNITRSPISYLLTTTFPAHKNHDYITGAYWRPVNLERAPFGFPPPLQLINEGCTEIGGACVDKSLGLWRIDDLRRMF